MIVEKEFVKKYFKLGLPVIISQMIVILTNNLSVSLFGNLSSKAISGYTLANEAYTIFSMIALGLTGGFHIFIAQSYGVHNKKKYNQVIRYGMKICLIVSFSCSIAFYIFSEEFIRLFASDQDIVEFGIMYLKIFCWSFIPYMLNLLWSETYSFIGQSRISMVGGAVNGFLNVLLCYIFLKIFNLGIEGGALALLSGRLVESCFLIYVMNRNESEFKFSGKYPRLNKQEKIDIIVTSLPLILNESIYSIAMVFIMKNYSYVSETSLACLTVVTNVSQLFFVGNKGASSCVGVMVGGELGKGNFESAKENAIKIYMVAVYCCLIGAICMFICSSYIPKVFSLQGNLEILCLKMIFVKCITGVIGGNTFVFYNILRIGGATKDVFCMDGLFTVVGPLFASFLCSRVFNTSFFVFYIVQECMLVLKTIVSIYFFYRGNWIKKIA